MCGIIARISEDKNPDLSLKALSFLQYRGYDSYGILLRSFGNNDLKIEKNVGSIPENMLLSLSKLKSNIEIGHTRWATHGGVSIKNAHPHSSFSNIFHVVMNGIIENYSNVKNELINHGYLFKSDTDTEVIVNLYEYYMNLYKISFENIDYKILLKVTKEVICKLEGEFSYVLNCNDMIIAYKNINPLIAGYIGNGFVLSSDMNYVDENSLLRIILDDQDIFFAYKLEDKLHFGLSFMHSNTILLDDFTQKWENNKQVHKRNICSNLINGLTFMEQEIFQSQNINLFNDFNIKNIQLITDFIKENKTDKIYIIGSGTSYNAGNVLHYILLRNGIISQMILGCELENYVDMINNSLLFVYSQSGETADIIKPLKNISEKHKLNKICVITNTPKSTIDRIADYSLYLNCLQEISVASTKAFVMQLLINYIIDASLNKCIDQIENFISQEYQEIFKQTTIDGNLFVIDEIIRRFKNSNSMFFIGRGINYPLAMEGALKMKEVSYIHCEGFSAGELKHGSLALIENDVPVFVIGCDKLSIANATEVKSRGGILIGIGNENNDVFDYFIKTTTAFKEVFSAIMMQLVALKMALALGNNPDKPRNLAKSVTVK